MVHCSLGLGEKGKIIMRRVHRLIGLAALLGAAVVSSPALAVVMAYSPTGHLNVRSGPGFQYQVVNQIQANVPVEITGCVSDYSWCSVALPGGATGWASAPYLVTKAAGQPKNMQVVGAQLGIPVIVPVNTGGASIATPPPVGAMAPVTTVVTPIVPPTSVTTFVTQQTVAPVIVNGEVMVGAALPVAATTYDIPASNYDFAYVNSQRVLVDPTGRKIVYVFP
jgi:uncharacterized protein YraI